MRYVRIVWKHELSDEPAEIFSALQDDGMENKRIEIFKNKKSVRYSLNHNSNGLSEEPFPSVDEYNFLNRQHSNKGEEDDLIAYEISYDNFLNIWKQK